jgi:hypothetical protein
MQEQNPMAKHRFCISCLYREEHKVHWLICEECKEVPGAYVPTCFRCKPQPKEHPAPFVTDLVRAILDGRKTQTRRLNGFVLEKILNIAPPLATPNDWDDIAHLIEVQFLPGFEHAAPYERRWFDSPYRKGDSLWVRETWNISHRSQLAPGETIGKSAAQCAADNKGAATACADGVVYKADGTEKHPQYGKALWRPSIHMPRWATRITLPLIKVWPEPLQDITEGQARAEGLPSRDAFKVLWDSLYARKGLGWDKNPVVWVLEWEPLTLSQPEE